MSEADILSLSLSSVSPLSKLNKINSKQFVVSHHIGMQITCKEVSEL
jgi:hypothetical protein